jgi:hypothetical protein
MQSFTDLTPNQRGQVDRIFADELFGTDAGAYLYHVDGNGNVTGRQPKDAQAATVSTKRVTEFKIKSRVVLATDEQIKTAQMHMDALAASVARKLYQHEEVNT